MRRFILPADWDGSELCSLSLRDSRRLTQVLRLREGDRFPAMATDGRCFDCSVLEAHPSRARIRVQPADPAVVTAPGEQRIWSDVRSGMAKTAASATCSIPELILGLGLLKGTKLDDVVRMAAEAGVSRIVLLLTDHCVARNEGSSRIERLQRIAREALGQSGSAVPTAVTGVRSLADFIEGVDAGPEDTLRMYFHEQPLARRTLHQYCTGSIPAVVACIGPEGGFSGQELERFERAAFLPAWLGPSVLRAESAAIFALASLRLLFLERDSWTSNA